MEQNIQDQPQAPNQTPIQPIQNPVINQRGFFPIVIGVIILLLIVGGGAYYLGLRNNNDSESKSNQLNNVVVTPTVVTNTPIPTQQPSQTTGLLSYTNQQYGYTIKYPSNLEISQMDLKNAPYSAILFNIKQTEPDVPGFPIVYVSVIPDGFTNTNSVVYNFMPADLIDSFFSMNVGETKSTQTGTYSEFWTYKKVGATNVSGVNGVIIENDKVWDGGNGLKDRQVFLRKNGFIYMIGAYYQTPQELADFQTFLSNFSFTK